MYSFQVNCDHPPIGVNGRIGRRGFNGRIGVIGVNGRNGFGIAAVIGTVGYGTVPSSHPTGCPFLSANVPVE